jgi:hypothetical protein
VHHAYLIIGDRQEVINRLEREFDLPINSPDLWREEFDTFGIEASRELTQRQSRRAFNGEKKYFILMPQTITVEAQNALLRTLEEPTPGTHIFLIMPQVDTLLPTLRSRCQLLDWQVSGEAGDSGAQAWLTLEPSARLKQVEKIIKSDNAKAEAIKLLLELQSLWHRKRVKVSIEQYQAVMSRLGQLTSYLTDRSSAVKLILEETAFLIPKL